ncbi:hypothetical protein GCM10009736_15830 [Actinomadura bangladeshensis]
MPGEDLDRVEQLHAPWIASVCPSARDAGGSVMPAFSEQVFVGEEERFAASSLACGLFCPVLTG